MSRVPSRQVRGSCQARLSPEGICIQWRMPSAAQGYYRRVWLAAAWCTISSATRGPATTITGSRLCGRGGTYNKDGVIVLGSNGLFRVPASGGPARLDLDRRSTVTWPDVRIWESGRTYPRLMLTVYRPFIVMVARALSGSILQIGLARLDVLGRFISFETSRSYLVDDRVDIDSGAFDLALNILTRFGRGFRPLEIPESLTFRFHDFTKNSRRV